MAAWQAIYWSAAKIVGHKLGTITRARFKLKQKKQKKMVSLVQELAKYVTVF